MTKKFNQLSPADQVRTVRLFLKRRLDNLLEKITAPDYSGYFHLEVHAKHGRLFEPKSGDMRTGVWEE